MNSGPSEQRIARSYVGGNWVSDRATSAVMSPATGEQIGDVMLGEARDVDDAVVAARHAALKMRKLGVWERAALCRRISDAIRARERDLAYLLTLEQGKPFHTEAIGEVAFAAEAFEAAAEQIKWLDGSSFMLRDPQKRGLSFLRPKGTYGIVTPWNFPLLVPCAYYLAPGIAAGNAFVWVPAPTTSLVSTLLMEAMIEADLPTGAINLVTGFGPVVGDALVGHPGIDAIGFTGSTATGAKIAVRAAGKPMSLELGGNGPTIVLDDADVADAARRSAMAAFTNAGQICTSSERILVHASVYDEFVEEMSRVASKVQLGNPFEETTTMGPLHNEQTAAKVDFHLNDARERKGQIVFGGNRARDLPTALYYQPTVIADVSPDSLLNCEETFGPVAPVVRFADDDQLDSIVAHSRYGLFASVFTRSVDRAFRYAEGLNVGTVHVNEMSAYWDLNISGGGASGSLSGIGRIGIRQSIEAMSDTLTMTIRLA